MKKSFLITEDSVDSRVDKWFKRNVCKVPQSLIEKNLRKGNIKINGSKVKSSYKVKLNDEIKIYNINFASDKNRQIKKKYFPNKNELTKFSSLFVENNSNFVVINKPSGIAVQGGTKVNKNIIDILRNTPEFKELKPFPVHRIDKETSGLLIVAKNRKYAQLFTSLFRIRKIHKIYLAIVLGEFEKSKGRFIDELISFEGNKKIKNKAITDFSVIDSNTNYTFLKLSPQTGRKHQLRKQLLIHGHPVLGDNKYRINNFSKSKKNLLMLHAFKINFSIDNLKYNFYVEPPLYFKSTLSEKRLKSF
tara:strand:+ start:610 stop:1521 length:912 start_codon:yes stop_codon:yes gene_type:complete